MITENFIDVDGVRTRYKEAGAGPPIVMIHGGEFGRGAGADAWPDELYEGFAAAGYRAIGIDRLGQAMTADPLDESGYRMSAVVRHAERLLRAIGVSGAVVMGQSRGGYVSARLALDASDLVDRLVIINSGSITPGRAAEPLPGTPQYHVYKERASDSEREEAANVSFTTAHITDEWVAKKEAMKASPVRARTKETFEPLRRAYFEEFEPQKVEAIERLRAGEFRKPTLVIWGIGDPTTAPEDALGVYGIFRTGGVEHLRLYLINRAGHWPFREYPDEICGVVLDFLGRSY